MQEFERESSFVNHMVTTLIDRYAEKLGSITPQVDEEAILRESGIKGINVDMDRLEDAYRAIDDALAHRDALAADFRETYNEATNKLVKIAVKKLAEDCAEKCRKFEFKVREAIGLVELVGGPEAFAVLQECRQEIEDME